MPIRNQRQLSRGTYTLDSDSDDDLIELHLSRYQEAEYGTALSSRANYTRATEELTAILRQAYGQYASKAVQELVYEDILLAVRRCTRLEQHRKSLIVLVETAKQRLPQLKLRRVQQEYKKRLVLLSRKEKQPGTEQSDEDPDDLLGELPLEVVHHMFGFLDPLTLGKAACVCSAWHQIVTQDDSLWKRCFQQVTAGNMPLANSSQQPLPEGLTYQQLFISTVTSLPRLLGPLRSNRVFHNNVLAWRDNSMCSMCSLNGAGITPSVQMVVSYMLGLPIRLNQEQPLPESDSDEEELTGRVNRLWRPSLRPMVKSYSHASM